MKTGFHLHSAAGDELPHQALAIEHSDHLQLALRPQGGDVRQVVGEYSSGYRNRL